MSEIDKAFQFPVGMTWKDKVQFIAYEFAKYPQVEMPLKHHFAPGVYMREIFMPAGSIVIGKIHRTEHFNIIQKGKVTLYDEHGSTTLEAPVTFVSKAGVQKLLYIHEDCVWSTVHVTDSTDVPTLERDLVEVMPELFPETKSIEKQP